MTDIPPAARQVRHAVWRDGTPQPGQRLVAEETAVAFTYDGATHAVLMASPADLEDLAIGFTLTEGIVADPGEIADIEVVGGADGINLRIWLSAAPAASFAARRRRYVGPAGCGMCGLESLAEARREVPRLRPGHPLPARDIALAVAALPHLQSLNAATRAVHAAGFWQPGHPMLVREDVGRHNALDKLTGALARQARGAADGVVVLSSRVSIELVQKAAMLGAPILVALSAPTALAIRTAEQAGITLIGIARDDGFEVFTRPERIATQSGCGGPQSLFENSLG
jgi:FdhD protein